MSNVLRSRIILFFNLTGLFKRIYLKLEFSDRSTSIRAIISECTPANLANLSLLLLVTSTWFRWPYIFEVVDFIKG